MVSDSRKIYDAFIRQEPAKPIDSFERWLGDNCVALTGIDISQVDKYVESQKRRLWNFVKNAEHERKFGRRELIGFIDDDRMLFNNIQHDMFSRPKNIRDLKLAFRWALIGFIDQLDWRQYEALAAVAACHFGAEEIELTPRGNEGGVDLYAVIPTRGPTGLFHGKSAYYRIVGQSKRYVDPVDVGATREFIKTIDNIRCRAREIDDRIPDWFHRYDGPIIGWINAHAGFQSGSIDIGRSHGVILSDTLTLCEGLLSIRRTPVFHASGPVKKYFAEQILAQLSVGKAKQIVSS